MSIEERVERMQQMITFAGIICGLNLTVYEGTIAFVDQKEMEIVAVWNPEYTAADIPGGN